MFSAFVGQYLIVIQLVDLSIRAKTGREKAAENILALCTRLFISFVQLISPVKIC